MFTSVTLALAGVRLHERFVFLSILDFQAENRK